MDAAAGDALPVPPDVADGGSEPGDAAPADTADAAGPPMELLIKVQGNPALLQGVVTVEVVPSPPEAFFGIEIRLGSPTEGAKLGNLTSDPYALAFDSAEHPDGPGALWAIGVAKADGSVTTASVDVVLENHPPALVVIAPADGLTVTGSATAGFSLAVEASATDGNGIAALHVRIGDETIPIDPTTGKADVALPTGVDFPHTPVSLVFRAVDGTGAEATVVRSVTPSIVRMRFDRDVGYGTPFLNRLLQAEDGTVVAQVGMNSTMGGYLYVLPEPVLGAVPALVVDSVQPNDAVLAGGILFYNAYESGEYATYRAPLSGEPQKLLSINTGDKQNPSFSTPFVHSSGTVLMAWFQYDVAKTHLLAFEADGTPLYEKAYAGLALGDNPVEAPDGRLLATTYSPTGAQTVVQPFDVATGEASEPWTPPPAVSAQGVVFLDALGAIVRCNGPATSGPPVGHVASFDIETSGLQWCHELQPFEHLSAILERLPSGDVAGFFYGTSPGTPSSLKTLGESSVTTLWEGGPDHIVSLVGRLSPEGDLILTDHDTVKNLTRALRVAMDGTEVFGMDLGGPAAGGARLLADGALAVATTPPGYPTSEATISVVTPGGTLLWSAELEASTFLGFAEQGVLVAAYFGPVEQEGYSLPKAELTYEARNPKSGALRWRYREGPCPYGTALWTMLPSAAWDALLVPMHGVVDVEGAGPTMRAGVLGLVP